MNECVGTKGIRDYYEMRP